MSEYTNEGEQSQIVESEQESNSNVNVIHRGGGVIENTLGRIGSVPRNILLGTPKDVFRNVPRETVDFIKERTHNMDLKGQVDVYLNHTPLFKQMKRLFSKDRKSSFFARMAIGLPSLFAVNAVAKLGRMNHYNPFTESVSVYHSNPAIAMHELGHAEDFNKSKYPALKSFAYALPFVRSKMEWNASHNAMKHLKPHEREDARKVLEPAFGAHVGGEALAVASVIAPPLRPIYALAGVIAGHIHSRTSKNNIFFKG